MTLNNIISTTVNSKTGTKIVKELAETVLDKNKFVRTRVTYGENTPMVTKYGIKEILKNKDNDAMDILTTSGKNIIFAPKDNWGGPRVYSGSGTAKERFSQLLEMLKIMNLS